MKRTTVRLPRRLHFRRKACLSSLESLESRIAPAYSGTLAGSNASLVGDSAGDTLIISAVNGFLQHNRFTAGDPGFASNADFDSVTPGVQTLAALPASGVTISTGDGDDTVILGGNRHAELLQAAFQVNTTGATGDTLLVDESADLAAQSIVFTGPAFLGRGINVVPGGDGFGKTTLRTGAGADTVTLTGTIVALTVIETGAGDDTVQSGNILASLELNGGPGNDHLSGGAGGDTIHGGPGQDTITGGRGNDLLFGDGGLDNFIWNPGDASDTIDGGTGVDRLIFNGSNANENIALSAIGNHLRLTRDVANIIMDVAAVEQLDLPVLGGADNVTATGLSATALQAVHVNFGAVGVPDGQTDTFTVNGSDFNDSLRLEKVGSALRASGFGPLIELSGFDTFDQLTLNGGLGTDNLFVASNVAGALALTTIAETASNVLPAGHFATPASFDAGKTASSIATGNLFGTSSFVSNDLVIADGKANVVLILQNAGHGLFSPAIQLGSGGKTPHSVVLQDFNEDGFLDIAVTNTGSGTVGILLNDGNGGFHPATTFAAGRQPGILRAADLDQDGHLDLVMTTASNSFTILSGKGDGTFDPPSRHSSGGIAPSDLAIADLNGDGRNDIAVANGKSNSVAVFTANPDFTLAAPDITKVGIKPTALATGDFDGDGRVDLAVSHGVSRFVSVLLSSSDADSLFGTRIKLTHATGSALAVDDVNEDGRPDIVVGSDTAGAVSVFLNLGGATFQLPRTIDLGNFPPRRVSGLVLADFNGDGHLDLATANAGTADVTIAIQSVLP